MADAPPRDADSTGAGGVATLLYLVGFAGFLLSGLAFVGLLVLGVDLRAALLANAAAAILLVAWAAYDTFHDPDSEVDSVPGALGTGMLLLAVYGLLAGVVVAVTSLFHAHADLLWWYGGGAVLAAVLGFVTFPLEVFMAEDSASSVEETE